MRSKGEGGAKKIPGKYVPPTSRAYGFLLPKPCFFALEKPLRFVANR